MIFRPPDQIRQIGFELLDMYDNCRLCPMECRINRNEDETGECNSGPYPSIASYQLHFGEEPPLSTGNGSGTIFFSNCNLSCVYCQNFEISQQGTGKELAYMELCKIMLELQEQGANNINFVTPTHYLPAILPELAAAKEEGLHIPIVYNSSGYEKVEILEQIDGIIDIYLVDMRYSDSDLARKYSGCENYAEINRAAVKEMYRQVGLLKTNAGGVGLKGMIVRLLVLPEGISGTEDSLKFLADEVSRDIYVSLMKQYHPSYRAGSIPKINRAILPEEFDKSVKAFYDYGLHNGHIQ